MHPAATPTQYYQTNRNQSSHVQLSTVYQTLEGPQDAKIAKISWPLDHGANIVKTTIYRPVTKTIIHPVVSIHNEGLNDIQNLHKNDHLILQQHHEK
jgi:hypothetical protein